MHVSVVNEFPEILIPQRSVLLENLRGGVLCTPSVCIVPFSTQREPGAVVAKLGRISKVSDVIPESL